MQKNTTLCYLKKDGCYLMLHRVKKQNDENHDKWIAVGGHFEEGESPEECAAREIYEETGLRATSLAYRGIVTFVSDVWPTEYMHLFCTETFEGTLTDCDEGELAWVPIGQIASLPIWEGDKIFMELIADENEPFFSLKLVYRGEKLIEAVKNGQTIRKETER